MLKKSQIFYFIVSFTVTFLTGFFIWNIFISPDNGILNSVLAEANKITSKIFPASVSDSNPQDIILATDSEEENQAGLDLLSEKTDSGAVESQNLAIAEPESAEDQLDDIEEKLDIISQQISDLMADSQPVDQMDNPDEDKNEQQDQQQEEQVLYEQSQENICAGGVDINTASEQDLEKIINVGPVTAQKIIDARPFCSISGLLRVSGIGEKTLQEITQQGCAYVVSACVASGGGGGEVAVYPKILISEVQVAGSSDAKEEFVELYNPNDTEIDLTNWYLQKETSGGSVSYFDKKSLLSDKKISPRDYFLIARSGYFGLLSDVSVGAALSGNTSLIFKNPNNDVSDEVGWGNSLVYELSPTQNPGDGKSIGRKVLDGSAEQDTDNNSADFEIDTPTPRFENVKWTEPELPTLESIEITTTPSKLNYLVGDELDISGLVVTGNYSDGTAQIEPITSDNITGFDSSTPAVDHVLTITIGELTANYSVNINRAMNATLPSGTIIINNGAEYTNSRDVILSLSTEDDSSEIVEMNIANASYYHGWEPYSDSKEWQLPDTNGVKTVRVKFRDSEGNETAVGIPDTIILDTAPPVITLNGDSEINLNMGDDYEEPGAVVFDLIDIGCPIVISGDIVSTASPANFNIFYDATDSAGNHAEQVERTVIVE